jgi:hypothetical protein
LRVVPLAGDSNAGVRHAILALGALQTDEKPDDPAIAPLRRSFAYQQYQKAINCVRLSIANGNADHRTA